MKIQADRNLRSLNTMALPAVAQQFVEADSEEQIRDAILFAAEHALPLFVLGGGSNVIFAGDYPGLVLHLNNKGVELLSESENTVTVRVQAGEVWDEFLQVCIQNQWYGLENLAIIPGTVGAAPVQNIGAYGQEVAQCIRVVHGLNRAGEPLSRTVEACQFSYRNSIFKQSLKDEFIITAVDFDLEKRFVPNVCYGPLQAALTRSDDSCSEITAQALRDAVIKIRTSKLPDPSELANSGSFFKNPLVERSHYLQLQEKYSDIPGFSQDDGRYKLAAGWLIEQAGWKGRNLGPAGMYEKQALVMVNRGGASFDDVRRLTLQVQQDVESAFGVLLEQEPVIVDAVVTV